jgi:gluconokinase
MAKLIGLDLGTTNAKAVLLDEHGVIMGTASSGYRLHSPYPGWAEQSPQEVWTAAMLALSALSKEFQVADARGLCLSGAMHTLFPLDNTDQPMAPSMTWADQRASWQADGLVKEIEPLSIYQRTGCPVNAFYYPARLRWWAQNLNKPFEQARFSSIKDWVLLRLTGRFVTDFSIASSTGLLNTRERIWDTQALALAGITKSQLPELVSPLCVVGELTPEWARLTGLAVGLPVIAGASDGGLANLGSGAVSPGDMVITVGTSGAVRRVVSQPWLDSAARTWCYVLLEDRWFVGGAINSAGLAVQWVREKFYPDLAPDAGYKRLMQDAGEVSPGADSLVFLPYFAGERSPHWNPALRASLVGLSLEHTRSHVARAVLEGVAYCLLDVWQVLTQSDTATPGLRLTGGITQSPMWMQLVADVIGARVLPVEVADASAVGAGIIGAYALGLITNLDSYGSTLDKRVCIEPDPEIHEIYQKKHQRYRELFQRVALPGTGQPSE